VSSRSLAAAMTGTSVVGCVLIGPQDSAHHLRQTRYAGEMRQATIRTSGEPGLLSQPAPLQEPAPYQGHIHDTDADDDPAQPGQPQLK